MKVSPATEAYEKTPPCFRSETCGSLGTLLKRVTLMHFPNELPFPLRIIPSSEYLAGYLHSAAFRAHLPPRADGFHGFPPRRSARP